MRKRERDRRDIRVAGERKFLVGGERISDRIPRNRIPANYVSSASRRKRNEEKEKKKRNENRKEADADTN